MALAPTNLDPDGQIRNMLVYDDEVLPGSGLEVTGGTIEDNLHGIISQINRILNATAVGNEWWVDINTPSSFENGAKRGVLDLNTDLHDLQRKRILKRVSAIALDVPVTTAATSTLTGTANFANTETVTIDAKVYTFQTVLTDVDGNVAIGVDLATSLSNLAGAINLTGVAGTDYATLMTLHPTVFSSAITATTMVVTAKTQGAAADSIVTTETGANASWPGGTLGAGTGGGSTTDFIVLANSQLPSTTTAAIGSVTTLGLVVATAGSFGTAGSLDEVTGANALQPKNLWILVDSATGDPLTRTGGVADDTQVYGLAQSQSAIDGSTITGGSGNGLQISLVVRDGAGADLELITAGDVPSSVTIDYAYVRRDAFEDCPEEAWLGGGFVDSGVSTATRQAAYDNQGVGVVTTGTNATLDVGLGFIWEIGDGASAPVFTVTEDSGGSATSVVIGTAADTYTNNALDVDFTQGIQVDTDATINLGITANQIDFTAAGKVTGTGTMLFTADSANVTVSTTTGGNVLLSSAAAIDAQAVGAVTIDSSGGAIGIGTDADTGAVNVGTAGARAVTVGSVTAGTTLLLNSGSAGVDLSAPSNLGELFTLTNTDGTNGHAVEMFVNDVTTNPDTVGVAAPVGSVMWKDSSGGGVGVGEAWLKTGPNDDDWEQIQTGADTSNSLQQAYVAGNTITVDSTEGALEFIGTVDDATTVLTLTGGNHTGATAGNILNISNDASALGDAVFINNLGGGSAIEVQDGGVAVMDIASTGAVTFTPTSGTDFTVTTAVAGNVDINAGTAVTIDATLGGISLDATGASNFTTTSGSLTLSTADSTAGQNVVVSAGDSSVAATVGGAISVTAGDGATTAAGGALDLDAGAGGATGTGGAVTFDSGAGGATSGAGGAMTFTAGAAATSGAGGVFTATAGAGAGNGSGGDMALAAGTNGGTFPGIAGIATLTGGVGVAASGGDARLTGGSATVGSGGRAQVTGGAGGTTNGDGGDVLVTGGAGGVTNGQGGDIIIASGVGAGSGGDGTIDIGITGTPQITIGGATMADGISFVSGSGEVDAFLSYDNSAGTLGDAASIYIGDSDPTAATWGANNASESSLFHRGTATAGELWLKTGAAATAWTRIATTADTGSTLEAAWTAATGAGATLGTSGFTGRITDTDIYLIETLTTNDRLLSLAAVAGADVVGIGNSIGASVLDLDSGTGGTAIDSTGSIDITSSLAGVSIDATGGGNFTTVGGDLTLSTGNTGVAADVVVSAGDSSTATTIGGGVSVTTGDGNTTGAGGVLALTGGLGGATDASAGGAINITSGSSAAANGNSGAINIEAGAETGTGSEGAISIGAVNAGAMLIGINGGGVRIADSLSLGSTAGISATADTTITLTTSDIADASGSDISVNAATSSGAGNDGASIRLLPGDGGTTGAHGSVDIDGAFDADEAFLTLTGSGASGNSDLYAGSTLPAHTAAAGSLYFRNVGSGLTGGSVYVQVDASTAGEGSDWEQLASSGAALTRQHFQTTMFADVSAGSPINTAAINGTMPSKPASGFTFNDDTDMYLNGIILFNGTEVEDGTGDDIDVTAITGPTFRVDDVITIIYYTNSTAG